MGAYVSNKLQMPSGIKILWSFLQIREYSYARIFFCIIISLLSPISSFTYSLYFGLILINIHRIKLTTFCINVFWRYPYKRSMLSPLLTPSKYFFLFGCISTDFLVSAVTSSYFASLSIRLFLIALNNFSPFDECTKITDVPLSSSISGIYFSMPQLSPIVISDSLGNSLKWHA